MFHKNMKGVRERETKGTRRDVLLLAGEKKKRETGRSSPK